MVGGRIDLSKCDRINEEAFKRVRKGIGRGGDIVLTHNATIGRLAITSDSDPVFVTNPQTTVWRSNNHKVIIPKYLYYFMCSAGFQDQLEAHKGRNATFDYVSLTKQRGLVIPVIDVCLQQSIVSVLGPIDDRITLLRETNATLEAIAQALFKSWFVDFDPVRAKAEGLEPQAMDAPTAALFPDSFEESELGLVPQGWSVQSIYDIARVIYGAPFASKRFNPDGVGIPLVRIRDLKDESPGVYTDEVHPKGYMILPGDIVVGMDGEFRAYLWGGKPAWLNQRVCVFAPESGVPAAFVHKSITPLLAAVEASETATTVIHLGKNDIDRFRVVVPEAMVLAAFSEIVSPIYARIVEGKQAASTLVSIRDTLLPRLISGQLRLPDAQLQVQEALS